MATDPWGMVFDGPGRPLRRQVFARPRPEPGEALVRVRLTTLCGSDLHTWQGHRDTPLPTLLGHEILGEIEALGEGTRAFDGRPLAVGDRVTWSLAVSDGTCFYCREGLPQKCESLVKYGHAAIAAHHALNGGLASHVHLLAGSAILPVPASLPDSVACPANCATATVAAAMRTAGALSGCRVLLFGAGALGLTAAAWAADAGAEAVLVCDPDAARRETAHRFGASAVLPAAGPAALAAAVASHTAGRGADVAFDFSGSPDALESGLAALRIGGRFVWIGAVFPTRPLGLVPETIVRRMLTVTGVHNYTPTDLSAALGFLAGCHQRYPFAELVGEAFALADADAAFEASAAGRAARVAVTP